MKKYASIISFLVVFLTAFWSLYNQKPNSIKEAKTETEFSIDKALTHLKNITKEIHHVGTEGHKKVQNYLMDELKKMGLNPNIQTQTVVNKKLSAGTTVENIVAKIEGKGEGKALLLLSHYDSNPNLGMGASDAGSGVVTILEGVRAFLAKGEQPKNDIIILISDAEELGLLGANAFVECHPWAKDVGLVLNFEARGSGGPSYMFMETNGKNSKLISEFIKANPKYPTSNSLAYSVYKILPNDTDLTVFRENGNINGFNFAFIGDHFDYHTLQDTYERLDRTSLAHQADYLMSSLHYFANSNINDLNSNVDSVYINFPFIKLLSYPFSWVVPLLLIAAILLLILIFFGFVLNKITQKQVLIGFIPSLISIALCGGITFLLWKFLLWIYPQYTDILHGFTYNGYWYLIAFACLNLWILYLVYKKFTKKDNITSLLVAPIIIWLIVNFLILEDFKGAGFFIIPVFIAEVILGISIFVKQRTKTYSVLFSVLSIPTVYILVPIIKSLGVGLGLGALFICAILIALLFGLLLPVINGSKSRGAFLKLSGLSAITFFIIASYFSGFNEGKKKPNSLVYIQNVSDSTAFWGTYNNVLDPFITQKLGKNPIKGNIPSANTKSKYGSRLTYHNKAKNVPLLNAIINIEKDTVIEERRVIDVLIKPQRKIQKIELASKGTISFHKILVNSIPLSNGKKYNVKRGSFLIYHFGNQDTELKLQMTLEKFANPEIIINEVSDDLLENPLFSIQPRSKEMMPMPFVTNNAIISTQSLHL